MSPTGDGLTSYGNADTHVEAGAPGTDITASSGYGGRKAPDAQAEQVDGLMQIALYSQQSHTLNGHA